MTSVPAGLCDTCAHRKRIHTTRGTTYSMCLRHRTEPERYPKYPPLPVRACAGHEPRDVTRSSRAP